jgi:predicted nucleotidyltransferase
MVADYINDIVGVLDGREHVLASVILFGSSATGGYVHGVSDVDLLIVLRDPAGPEARRRVIATVAEIETRHRLGKPKADGPLARLADSITANVRSFFVCTRADLISGDPARILGISPAQARFVDRAAIPSIVASGRTAWGEHLLDEVPLPPIRRIDVAKAFFSSFNHSLFCVAIYPVVPGATKYAMDALKRSLHNCYFCYHACPAPLADEVAFFEAAHGARFALRQLLALRRDYRESIRFVLACPGTIASLHWQTATRLDFPRATRR